MKHQRAATNEEPITIGLSGLRYTLPTNAYGGGAPREVSAFRVVQGAMKRVPSGTGGLVLISDILREYCVWSGRWGCRKEQREYMTARGDGGR